MSTNDKYLSFRDAILLVIFVVAVLIVIKIAMPLLYDNFWGRAIIPIVSLGGTTLVVCKFRQLDTTHLFPRKKYTGSVGPFFLVLTSLFLFERVTHEIEDILGVGLAEYVTRRGEWIFNLEPRLGTHIVSLVIIGPVMEELLFRGLIFGSFLKRYSQKKAIILSAILFGMLHVSFDENLFSSLVFPFVDGMFLAWILIKTNNITLVIVCHAFLNSLNYILPFLTMLLGGRVNSPQDFTIVLTVMLMIGVLFAGLAWKAIKGLIIGPVSQ